jgi:hypothetical protein
MGKLIFKGAAKKVSSLAAFKKKSFQLAGKKLAKERNSLLNDFDRHPVTLELKGGAKASNISRSLPGGYGNLFSFIGFGEGESPTEIVRDALETVKITGSGRRGSSGDRAFYSFRVKYPTLEQLKTVTSMPWETGLSWLARIEKGISGFGYYMNTTWFPGRSGEGFQADNKIRAGGYSPVSYYSGIINRFKKGMKKR